MLRLLKSYEHLPRKGEPVGQAILDYLQKDFPEIRRVRTSGTEENPLLAAIIDISGSLAERFDEFRRQASQMGYEMVPTHFQHPQVPTYAVKMNGELVSVFGYFEETNSAFFAVHVAKGYTHPTVLNKSADALNVPSLKGNALISATVVDDVDEVS